ncbi:MAG: DUF4198 domain-containing protein [Thermoanaerobaculia bacterium]
MLLFLAPLAPVAAHDYWLELSNFRPEVGKGVLVSHRVGEHLAGEAVPRNPLAILRFDVVDAAGEATPVDGRDGVDPAGFFSNRLAGTSRIVFESKPSFVELLPEKFADYLVLEGLEKIGREREKLGESTKLGREGFSRSAIAVLCSGVPGSARAKGPQPVGIELEIVAEHDPCAWKSGEDVDFRILFRGQPAPGLLVMALSKSDPMHPLTLRSDAKGRVHFRFPVGGFWLVKAVEMVRAEGLPNADWRSYWASMTFELPEPPK